jgi:uncharacterized membrane protein YphA (DoxX/SURF4 family)
LDAFGTRVARLGLAAASLGLGAIALLRALGVAEPLAAWADGLGATPPGNPLDVGLAVVLLGAGALLAADRAVPYAAALLAALLFGSLLVAHPGVLGATLDLGLLGTALSLLALPAPLAARWPRPLRRFVVPGEPGTRRLALRLGLALTFLLAGWGKFADTAWFNALLEASGGLVGWPLVGGVRPTALLLWLGTGEVLLSGLLVWGPPARLASAVAAVLLALDLLVLHTPSLLAAKTLGLLGAAVAGYCWASGATALENAQIGWLRASPRGDPPPDAPPLPPGAG